MHTAKPQSAAAAEVIAAGAAILGIELGSTRIKATVIGPDHQPIAAGAHGWENRLEDGVWTYHLDEVWSGLAACVADLRNDVQQRHGVALERVAALGISGMMHGYIALDADGQLLTPFRTWRNNITERASAELTALFSFPIPQRWTIAHLYQSILDKQEHVAAIARVMTLASYVHYRLTGQFVIGPDEASGMFPVDPATLRFDTQMLDAFDAAVADRGYSWKVGQLLPEVVAAGEQAGTLSEAGARLLDPTGTFAAGIPLCAPEGDAGTGMVATNSVRPRTGNVSAGTSVFAMLVLERPLQAVHSEIDIVLTPDGSPVAMAHSNNCTSDFDAWVALLSQAADVLGGSADPGQAYAQLMPLALEAEADAGGIVSIPYVSGEHVTGFSAGRPLLVRASGAQFTLPNFIRAHLFSALCAMRTGLNILFHDEGITVDEIRGHGGYFKTPGVGQRMMAAATGTPVSVVETAGEGGAWGMALLAAFMQRSDRAQALPDYLDAVFASSAGSRVAPSDADVAGFDAYFARYTAALAAERAAVQQLS